MRDLIKLTALPLLLLPFLLFSQASISSAAVSYTYNSTHPPDPTHEAVFYYHGDHLGSNHYISDERGRLQEHLEYFPFGEQWIEEGGDTISPLYRFTAKEFDEETKLTYFGARYYDPRTSVWISPDPILGKYLSGKPNNGVYSSSNLAFYTYTSNNPIKYIDPDGRFKLWAKRQYDGSYKYMGQFTSLSDKLGNVSDKMGGSAAKTLAGKVMKRGNVFVSAMLEGTKQLKKYASGEPATYKKDGAGIMQFFNEASTDESISLKMSEVNSGALLNLLDGTASEAQVNALLGGVSDTKEYQDMNYPSPQQFVENAKAGSEGSFSDNNALGASKGFEDPKSTRELMLNWRHQINEAMKE